MRTEARISMQLAAAVALRRLARTSPLVVGLALAASLMLVMPINGPHPRAGGLAFVHPVFPHGHPRGADPDGEAEQVHVTSAGAAFAPAGMVGLGLGLAISGVVATVVAGLLGFQTYAARVSDPCLLRHQAWPHVPVGPPR